MQYDTKIYLFTETYFDIIDVGVCLLNKVK
jgi:hypothetical protein